MFMLKIIRKIMVLLRFQLIKIVNLLFGCVKLVYFSFNDTKEIKGYVINHKDGNKGNNCLSNLEYITNAENVLHGKYELGSKKAVKRCRQIDNQGNVLKQYNSLTQAAKEIGGSVSGISLAVKNNTTYKGYYWN